MLEVKIIILHYFKEHYPHLILTLIDSVWSGALWILFYLSVSHFLRILCLRFWSLSRLEMTMRFWYRTWGFIVKLAAGSRQLGFYILVPLRRDLLKHRPLQSVEQVFYFVGVRKCLLFGWPDIARKGERDIDSETENSVSHSACLWRFAQAV